MHTGLQAGEQAWWPQAMVLNFVCQALMHCLKGQTLLHARHHQAAEMPADSPLAVQPGVLVPKRVRACGTMCLATAKSHPCISVMLKWQNALPATVCMVLGDAYASCAKLQSVALHALLTGVAACMLQYTIYRWSDQASSALSLHTECANSHCKTITSNSSQGIIAFCPASYMREPLLHCRQLKAVIQITVNTTLCCFPMPLFNKYTPRSSGTLTCATQSTNARFQA